MESEKAPASISELSPAAAFTATGRPIPAAQEIPFPTMARSSMGGITAPQNLPFKFTDETLMHVAVRLRPTHRPSSSSSKSSKMFSLFSAAKKSKPQREIKTIRLPRSQYLKHFARDEEGNYVGSEPERDWSEEELDAEFGKFWEWERPKWSIGWDEETGRKIMVAEEK